MRAIKINPWLRTVEEVDLPLSDYRQIYVALTHEGQLKVGDFESVRISHQDVMWVDEEGLRKPNIPVFNFHFYPAALAGIGLITGIDRAGETVAATIPLALVTAVTEWTSVYTTGRLTPVTSSNGVVHMGEPILKGA